MIRFDITLAILLLALVSVAIAAYRGGITTFYVLLPILVTDRFLRRVTDWSSGTYRQFPFLSLLGLLSVFVTFAIVVPRGRRLSNREVEGLYMVLGGLAYGFLLGLRTGFAAVMELAEYLAPIATYAMVRASHLSNVDNARLIRTVGLCGVMVSIYGLYQYAYVPPWDAFWMENCGMHSIGRPVAYEIRVFSTLSDANIAGMFLAFACIPMLVEPRWRPLWLPGVVLVVAGLGITLVRTAWLMVVLGVGFWMLRSSPSKAAVRGSFLVAGIIVLLLLAPALPGGQRVMERLNTFQDIGSDRSASGRVDILQHTLLASLANPFGHGLGSTGGVSGRLSETDSAAFDNGLTAILFTFGMPGLLLFGGGVWMIAQSHGKETSSEISRLRAAILVALLMGLTSLNILKGDLGCVIMALIALRAGKAEDVKTKRVRFEEKPLPLPLTNPNTVQRR